MRPIIQDVKLNCNGNKNVFQAVVENKEPANNPMMGPMIATAVSYSVFTQNEETDPLLLHSVQHNRYDLQLVATILTTQDIENALRWLHGVNYKHDTVENVSSGLAEYFEALKTVNINGNVSELTEFIEEHKWEGPCIWFPKILEEIHHYGVEDKKRMLRRYIHENLAWMTKILLLLSDGLHRAATIDGATVGVAPPGASHDLIDKTDVFVKSLTARKVGDHNLLALPAGQDTKPMDSLIAIGIKFPNNTLDARFCRHMRMHSGKNQQDQAQSEVHTIKFIIHEVLQRMKEKMAEDFRPSFLLGPGLHKAWGIPIGEKK